MYNIIKFLAEDSSSVLGNPQTPGTTNPAGLRTVNNGNNVDLPAVITSILNGVIGVLGIVCVVVMIIGGINYMTSAGDASKVEKGKKTILYGLIGLVVCVLAFAVVNFVIQNIIGAQNTE